MEKKNPRSNNRGNSKHFDSTQLYRGTYGGRVRAYDPDTSWAVAPIAPQALSDLHEAILRLLTLRPMHQDALVRAYASAGHPRRSPQRIGTARAELVARGLVRNSGSTAFSDYGNASIVWEIVP